MPYDKKERSAKFSHTDLLKNPDVKGFVEQCQFLREPTDKEAQQMASSFMRIPFETANIPRHVVSIDGSRYETTPKPDQLPSTRFGFVKIVSLLIDLKEMSEVYDNEHGLIDPCAMSRVTSDQHPIHLVLPGSNLRYNNAVTVADGFREALHNWLNNDKYAYRSNGSKVSLASTLNMLAEMRPNSPEPGVIHIHKCPSCGFPDQDSEGRGLNIKVECDNHCPSCGTRIYPSDCLRIHECIDENLGNEEGLNRTMSVVEHLLMVHYMRQFLDVGPHYLGKVAFFLDGPLAVFGQPAWMHKSIMIFLDDLKTKLEGLGVPMPLVLGIQKNGQLNDYLNLISRHLENGKVMAVSDDFRYTYVQGGRTPASTTYGYETYYGQDFVFKTPSGHAVVFNLPYPFRGKGDRDDRQALQDFIVGKSDISKYEQLPSALRLISELETRLHKNALIPTVLAHRYTAISLSPGGRVLDLLTKMG